MKTLEFIYQETQIHFLVNPADENVMVNATEMAKLFNKRIDVFLKTGPTKESIRLLEFPPTGVNLDPIPREKIIQTNHRYGTFFHRELAIEFAMWLDPVFKRWIIKKIDEVLFDNLKDYRDAIKEELKASNLRENLKEAAKNNPCKETIDAYFENEDLLAKAKKKRNAAVRKQKTLFQQDFVSNLQNS